MDIIEAVEVSINRAIKDGIVDEELHAMLLQGLRDMAVRAKNASERDNVTYPTLLKYAITLGMTPHEITVTKQEGERQPTTMERMRGKFAGYGK